MTIREFLEDEIYVDEKVRIDGKETDVDTDPFAWHIWEGVTCDIPEELRNLKIINDCWAIGAYIHVLEVFVPREQFPNLYLRSYSPVGSTGV